MIGRSQPPELPVPGLLYFREVVERFVAFELDHRVGLALKEE